MRFFWTVMICTVMLVAKSSTEVKIDRSQKNLSAIQAEKKRTSRRLERIASDIRKAEKELKFLDRRIEKLGKDINRTKARYEQLKKALLEDQQDLATTASSLERKQNEYIRLLSERFSILFAMQERHAPTRESIIEKALYQAVKQNNETALKKLQEEIEALKEAKIRKTKRRDTTQKALNRLAKRLSEYEKKKRLKQALLKRLAEDEEKYNTKLQKIIDRQNALKATLAQLHIIRKQELEKARKRAAARREAMRKERERKRKLRLARLKAKKAREALKHAKSAAEKKAAQAAVKEADEETSRVAKVSEAIHSLNASYKPEKTYRYRGKKTISPLPGAKVVKRFGTYIDPIYKIKIFNEGVTLQAPKRNAKVYNVGNGKVVFAGNTSMLGRVVVVAHSGKMHTVYAGLSQIAPFIKKGKKIKRGYVVGRVKRRLIFEVTKDTRHIDPLSFIKL